MENQNFETLAAQAVRNKNKGNISLSQVVVVQPPRRDSTDVDKWRNAIKAADRGRRLNLVELLNDLLLDPVLGDAVDRRIRKITNNDIVFLSDGEEIDEMYDFIDSPEFETLLSELMLTKAFGKSVIEIGFQPSFNVFSIPRQNLDTERKLIFTNLSTQETVSYENNEFLLNLGYDKDLGFLTKVAPYVIFKRNGGSDYAQFCELWGTDAIAYLYDPEEENGKQEMEATAEKRGSGASFVMSKNGDIKTISSNSNGAVHDTFLSWLDEQILIGVLGQTMTTKNGASLSQSKVHENTEDDISVADRKWIQRILNTYLIPLLEKRGYPVKNGFFKFVEDDKLTAQEKLDIATKVDAITTNGVDEEYFYATFGLPKGNKVKTENEVEDKTKVKTETKVKNEVEIEDEEDIEEEPKPKPKDKKKVEAKDLSFFERLKDFFDHAPQ